MPPREAISSTLQRSAKRAQEAWSKAHASAVETYGPRPPAYRTAFVALKHEFEKVGERWRPDGDKRRSESQPRKSTPRSRETVKFADVIDSNASKQYLYRVASDLDIGGRSKMSKSELIDAIKREIVHRNERSHS